jgi:hypothetical protein
MRVAVVLVLVLSLISEGSPEDKRKRTSRGFYRRPDRDQHGALSANTTITVLRWAQAW